MFKFYINLFFTLFGTLYFTFYYSSDYLIFKNNFPLKFEFNDAGFSYISGFFGFIFVVGIIGLISKMVEFFVNKVYSRNKTIIFVTDFVIRFVSIMKFILACYVFSYFAILPTYINDFTSKLFSILIIGIFLIFATSFVNKIFTHDLVQKSKLKTLSKTLLPFINKIIIGFIWIIGIITVFDNLGYDISALIAGAGIGGLAIAFAAQKSISNVFGAITILLNKPFKIGDYVTVNGVTGTVKDIGLSYITLIEKLGHQVMVPNETIMSTNVENFSVRKDRRTDFSIGLIYGTTLEKMKKGVQIIEEILDEYIGENTVSEYRVNFDMFSAFSLDIKVTYYSLINDSINLYLKQKEEINLEVKKRFKDAKLEMAFPTQNLIIKNEK